MAGRPSTGLPGHEAGRREGEDPTEDHRRVATQAPQDEGTAVTPAGGPIQALGGTKSEVLSDDLDASATDPEAANVADEEEPGPVLREDEEVDDDG